MIDGISSIPQFVGGAKNAPRRAHHIAWGHTRLFGGSSSEDVLKFQSPAIVIASYAELIGPSETLVAWYDGNAIQLRGAELDFNTSLVNWILIEL